jgi:hypothetical protein
MKNKSRDRKFEIIYIGEDKPEIRLYKGNKITVFINPEYIKQLYWVVDFKSLLAQVRHILNVIATKGTTY